MAPTKPLVFQQIEACFNIMGIPQTDMAEMTGIWLYVTQNDDVYPILITQLSNDNCE